MPTDLTPDPDFPNGSFYCPLCKTIFPTDGNAPASEAELANELQEHQAELHD